MESPYPCCMFHKLDENNKPVRCATGREWAEWYEPAPQSGRRVVARDELDGNLVISTIFTGIDLETEADSPRLFETIMFLNGKSTGVARRSETWHRAENQHRRMVLKARKADEDEDA